MELSDVETRNKVVAFLPLFIGLTSCTGYHIDTDKCMWYLPLNHLDTLTEECRIVMAMHQSQHLVRPTLQRDMEMRHETL